MQGSIAIHEAYVKGDLEALRRLLGNPPDFPNTRGPRGIGGNVLEYAIYWSPLDFIRTLLELGANPNYPDHAGFPSLIAALATERADKREILELLLAFGADVNERGVNGYTPLHYAAAINEPEIIELLLTNGADPNSRTNVDDYTTPLEEAERCGHTEAAEILRKFSRE